MLGEAALFLPPDVRIVAVSELDPAVARTLTDGAYLVTRPLGRTPSCVVTPRCADFIEEFRAPKTIATAIVDFGRRSDIASSVVLDAVLPAIARLVDAHYLVPADRYARPGRAFRVDEWFGPMRVLGVLGVMEDTEVYKVRDADDVVAVLKIASATSGRRMVDGFAHEADVLARLDGRCAPRLRAFEATGARPYLVLAWCAGESVDAAAARLRTSERPDDLRELAVRVLDAFAHVHARGVVHGDVHPGNVLCADSRVSLVDFGRAVVADGPAPAGPRGGAGFFYEPEFVRSGGRLRATAAGEQYALGALLFRVFAGEHYLALRLARGEAFRQIARDAPRTFASCGAPAWPEVEAILGRALAKRPEDRFESVAAFARALREARAAPEDARVRRRPRPDYRAYAMGAMDAVGLRSPLARATRAAPTASVTFGAAGIALAALRLSFAFDEPELLALAEFWATRAVRDATTGDGLRCERFGMTADTVAFSAADGASGVAAVACLVATAAGNVRAARERLDAFVATARVEGGRLDLISGASGVLATAALLYDAIPAGSNVDRRSLLVLGDDVARALWSRVDGRPALDATTERALGVAHGWAGILYATLSWSLATGRTPPVSLRARLHELATLREPFGSGSRWRTTHAADAPVRFEAGWCSGSAGFVFVWTTAYAAFRDVRFLDLAREAAWHVWEGTPASTSLCCGDAGRAYALLALHRSDRDARWLERATHLAARAVERAGDVAADPSARGESLFKGALGVAVLAGEMTDPLRARMPFFECDGTDRANDARLA